MDPFGHTGSAVSRSPAERAFPRAPLAGAGVLIAIVILLVAAARIAGPAEAEPSDTPAVEQRELVFEDRADGSVVVFDARSGAIIEAFPAGTNGFLRATMRGLARERRARGLGSEAPFRLAARADGRITLDDPATGRRVDLAAFGRTNAAAFASLLERDRT
jgi:putative photosynthetic complex assembly protein